MPENTTDKSAVLNKTAAEVSDVINAGGGLESSRVRLAMEYIRMEPGEFSQMLNKVAKDPANKGKLYFEDGDLKINDNTWPAADSTLFAKPKDYPSTTPAMRFVDIGTGHSSPDDVKWAKVAALGLIDVYKGLPKNEGKSLLNDAEDYYSKYRDRESILPLHEEGRMYGGINTNCPLVNFKFRDFDKDGQDELADARVSYGGSRRSTIQIDIYDPPASVLFPKAVKQPIKAGSDK